MKSVFCPHCKTHRIFTSQVPKDVVVVMPCPHCYELVVLFRDKVIAIDRQIIEHGTREERIDHVAKIIAEFFDAGMFSLDPGELQENMEQAAGMMEHESPEKKPGKPRPTTPISREELDRFVKIQLKCIDNTTYFKKHLS